MAKFAYTTQRDLRVAFWQERVASWGAKPKRKRGQYPTDVRVAWCDYIDALARNGDISEALAQRATLD